MGSGCQRARGACPHPGATCHPPHTPHLLLLEASPHHSPSHNQPFPANKGQHLLVIWTMGQWGHSSPRARQGAGPRWPPWATALPTAIAMDSRHCPQHQETLKPPKDSLILPTASRAPVTPPGWRTAGLRLAGVWAALPRWGTSSRKGGGSAGNRDGTRWGEWFYAERGEI